MSIMTSIPGILAASGVTPIGPPTWTSHDPNFAGNNVANDVAYGNGVWVCVGDGGELSSSTDAETWTLRTSSFSGTSIRGIYYGSDGYWVATGDGGKLATSTDGTTWTQRTSNTSENIQLVFYNGTDWVAACGNGKFIYNNGAPTGAWTEDSEAGSWIGCGYGNGLWTLCGTSSAMKTAATPAGTWTSRTSNVATATDVRYLGGIWLCCGSSGKLSTSSDGITWTNRTTDLGTATLRGIGYSQGFWFTGGLEDGDGQMSYSTTPTSTWTAFSPDPGDSDLTVNGFATDGTYIVAVLGRGVSPYHEILKGTFT